MSQANSAIAPRVNSSIIATISVFVCVILVGASLGCAAQVLVRSDHDLPAGPLCARMQETRPNAVYTLRGDNLRTLGQTDHNDCLWFWTDGIAAGQGVELTVESAPRSARADDGVTVERTSDEQIAVKIDGKLFTTLNFKKSEPRVYLYPVIGPTGAPVTRDYVMRDNPVEKDNKRQDHRHHRSFWTAYGDVRIDNFDEPGYDLWAERGGDMPRQVVTKIVRTLSGPVFGQIEAEIEWQTPEGKCLLTEDRTYTFFKGNQDQRMVDQKNVFRFDKQDVKFGQTKEGGICSLRLAVTMDERGIEKPQEMHGQMTNSRGGVGMKECWGKPAEWCDYVGPVDGQQVGVAILDCPKNFRHPTTWHIRDYGLYTANPFMPISKDVDRSEVFKKGETVEFNYRVIFHKDDTKTARIADQWKLYSDPPKITVR